MRKFFWVAVIASTSLWGQTSTATYDSEFQAAKKSVEAWMGFRLVIYEDGASLALSEARFTADSIAVSINQLRSFQSSQELAQFLAHAAAHARLGHPERWATLAKAVAILTPDRAAKSLEVNTRAELEAAALPVAGEFMESAGCAPGSCAMFGLLLRAARTPI